MPQAEKRRWPRFLRDVFQSKLICRLKINNEAYIDAGLRDISRRGAGLQNLSVYDRLSIGDEVLISTISQEGDFSILRRRGGRVQWVNPETGDFGLEFDEPLPYAKMSRRLYDVLGGEMYGRLVVA